MTSKRKNGHFNISFIFLCKILLFLFIIWSTYYYFSRKKLLLFYNWDADKIKKKKGNLGCAFSNWIITSKTLINATWVPRRHSNFNEGGGHTDVKKVLYIYICMLGQKYLKLIACQQKVSNFKIWLHVSTYYFKGFF